MPRIFSNEEYSDIHFVYGFCNGNAEEAVREYRRRFPNRRLPDAQVFVNTHIRFRNFGLRNNIVNEPYRNNNNRRNRRVLNLFNVNRQISTRRAARQLHLPQSTVWRTLHADRRRAFHFQPVQELHEGDPPRRLAFCNWLLEMENENAHLLRKILWTDEATFTRSGIVNYHNLHVWAHENPHAIRPRGFQGEFKVNVWAGLINNNVCGPHILPDRLNAQSFYEFLNTDLNNLMEDVPLNIRHEGWVQLDGAPPHYGIVVREWLDRNYPNRWIGRVGPIAWPPRSPDINPVDFYLWGTLKDKVYETNVRTRPELIQRIEDAFQQIKQNPDEVSRAIESLSQRSRKCIEMGGYHFEHLL